MHRRMKPLQRPQVRFDMERAVRSGDSCWVVVRITLPHRSVQKRELYSAQFVLNTPDAYMEMGTLTFDAGSRQEKDDDSDENQGLEIRTRSGRINYLYYSTKFAYDERMEQCTDITVFPCISDRWYCFYYSSVKLPVFWVGDGSCNTLWEQAALLPDAVLLDSLREE